MNLFRGFDISFYRKSMLFGLTGIIWSSIFAQPIPRTYLQDLPFQMPQVNVPSFKDTVFNIIDFGAVGNDHTLNTKAINGTIRACSESGGGTVTIPPGTWLTGSIELRNDVRLNVEEGALVQFSSNIEDFPLMAGFGGKSKHYVVTPPLWAYRARNIAITGNGIFDGAGEVWRYVKKEKLTANQWKHLLASGGVVSPDGREWWPSKEALDGEEYIKRIEKSGKVLVAADFAKAREYLRPDLVRFVQCDGIVLDGATFRNSPRFHIHPVQCENMVVRNVKIQTPWYAQNGDGLDLSACRNVVIYKTTVDVGDDALCIKPAKIASTQEPGPSCQNIVIADCIVYHGHGGFVIGSESLGGAKNISVRNCIFVGTDVGLRFKSSRGRGGLIEHIYVDGIRMRAIENEAILFDMYYGGQSPEVEAMKNREEPRAEAVNALTPRFENFNIKNIICDGASRAVLIDGLPEMPVKNITMTDMSIKARTGCLFQDAEGISMTMVNLSFSGGPAFDVHNCTNLSLRNINVPDHTPLYLNVMGERSNSISALKKDAQRAQKSVELGQYVPKNAVTLQ
jgi:DNA sulfur modification protein DndE